MAADSEEELGAVLVHSHVQLAEENDCPLQPLCSAVEAPRTNLATSEVRVTASDIFVQACPLGQVQESLLGHIDIERILKANHKYTVIPDEPFEERISVEDLPLNPSAGDQKPPQPEPTREGLN